MSEIRAGIVDSPCEDISPNSYVQVVKAGDRLKVGWTSGNRGGGWVRLSLGRYNKERILTQSNFDNNVLKVTCFGHDAQSDKLSYGVCNHPCGARSGCEFQATKNDIERYDTTITIPYNIKGDYILQMAAYIATSLNPVFSCSRIKVTDGDTKMPNCTAIASSKISKAPNCKNVGPFSTKSVAYKVKGGDIDDDIKKTPINVDCDPRVSCSLAKDFDQCSKVIKEEIINPFLYPILHCTLNEVGSGTKVAHVKKSCERRNIEIEPETPCNVKNDRITCSGSKIAQCAHVSTSTGVVGNYVFTACSPGTTCQITGDTVACVVKSC